MSIRHLSLDPHDIDANAWWYEEPDGIMVVIEFRDPKTDAHIGTEQRKLAWGSIRAALARRDKADKQGRKQRLAGSSASGSRT